MDVLRSTYEATNYRCQVLAPRHMLVLVVVARYSELEETQYLALRLDDLLDANNTGVEEVLV
jgi:hypothetical protein